MDADEPKAGEKATWDQVDVLAHKKDSTTNRGLQQWGDTSEVGGSRGHVGDASEGTAERAARITEGQLKAAERQKQRGLARSDDEGGHDQR